MSKRVLVVDDDESILDAVKLILEDSNFKVETSLKGDETYEIVRKFKPDVIVLDVLLSGKDGREICKKLKSTKETSEIPVIMISAHPGASESTREVGADFFLAKPFDPDKLIEAINKFSSV